MGKLSIERCRKCVWFADTTPEDEQFMCFMKDHIEGKCVCPHNSWEREMGTPYFCWDITEETFICRGFKEAIDNWELILE